MRESAGEFRSARRADPTGCRLCKGPREFPATSGRDAAPSTSAAETDTRRGTLASHKGK